MIQNEAASTGITKVQLREAWFPDPTKPKPGAELVEKISKATDIVSGWDHTGDENKRIAGDPDEAIRDLTEAEEQLEGLKTGDNEKDNIIQKVINDISQSRQGFQYRQEHGLESIYSQRDLIRREMAHMLNDHEAGPKAARMMEQLQNQPDASILVDILQEEYKKIIELMEEASESDEELLLSGQELVDHIFQYHLKGGLKTAHQLYQKSQLIKKNIDLIRPLLELQQQTRTLENLVDSQERMEKGSINGAIYNLVDEIGRLRRYKGADLNEQLTVSKHEDIEDPIARIEALIADIESELQPDPEEKDVDSIAQGSKDAQEKINKLLKKQDSKLFKWQVKLGMTTEQALEDEIQELIAKRNQLGDKVRRIYGTKEAIDKRSDSVQRIISESRELIESIKTNS
ncbi:MAG: hypothetical protein OEX81_05510 [Candidatus Pacebacteria bacterium]|nr:hypothetical protein [Candidatus Paceibacterota bacterium]